MADVQVILAGVPLALGSTAMMELIFINTETGRVMHAVTDVAAVRYITPSEVGYTHKGGRDLSCPFPHGERLEVTHIR